MGAHSLQGVALLMFLAAFTSLSIAMFYGGNVVALLVFAVALGASVVLFRKAKAIDHGVA